ncbi:MAG: hypothetical protein MJ238_00445 [Bacilli bacterium]|nr:hypothetical protein [Bacilli bacterium]
MDKKTNLSKKYIEESYDVFLFSCSSGKASTITTICHSIPCNRQTFYYHFESFSDFLYAFAKDKVLPLVNKQNKFEVLFRWIQSHKMETVGIMKTYHKQKATFNVATRILNELYPNSTISKSKDKHKVAIIYGAFKGLVNECIKNNNFQIDASSDCLYRVIQTILFDR